MVKHATMFLMAGMLLGGCSSNNKPDLEGSPERDQRLQTDGKFEAAEEPKFTADTHVAAGQLAQSQGHLPQAIYHYQEALKLEPKHERAMFLLGVAQAKSKQYPQAIETYQRYIRITRNSAAGYANLGYCYELAGDPVNAETAYRRGIAKDPNSRPCRINYGLMLARGGRVEEGAAEMAAVLKPAEVNYNLGRVFQQKKENDRAKACYQKALELDPTMQDARQRLAELEKQ